MGNDLGNGDRNKIAGNLARQVMMVHLYSVGSKKFLECFEYVSPMLKLCFRKVRWQFVSFILKERRLQTKRSRESG